jgi:hypothetical protein
MHRQDSYVEISGTFCLNNAPRNRVYSTPEPHQ